MTELCNVYFATNRDFNGSLNEPEFGERFNNDGPEYFRVGRAQVKRQGKDAYSIVSAQVEAEALNENIVGSRRLFDELRNDMRTTCQDVVLFIHGFANTFESSMERAAQLHYEYQITPYSALSGGKHDAHRPIVFSFSWPSNGRIFPSYEYHSDRDDARCSGFAMARALLRLLQYLKELRDEEIQLRRERNLGAEELLLDNETRFCGRRIHLVAHSMGIWTLRYAVNRLFEELHTQPLPRLFEHVLLMAADEDDDTFENEGKLGRLPGMAKFVHVYHSRGDVVLDVSDVTKGNPNRLGEVGPRNMDIISDRIYAIDCSDVDYTELGHGNHQYYRLRREVLLDVHQVLSGRSFDAIEGRTRTARSRSYRILDFGNRGSRGRIKKYFI